MKCRKVKIQRIIFLVSLFIVSKRRSSRSVFLSLYSTNLVISYSLCTFDICHHPVFVGRFRYQTRVLYFGECAGVVFHQVWMKFPLNLPTSMATLIGIRLCGWTPGRSEKEQPCEGQLSTVDFIRQYMHQTNWPFCAYHPFAGRLPTLLYSCARYAARGAWWTPRAVFRHAEN